MLQLFEHVARGSKHVYYTIAANVLNKILIILYRNNNATQLVIFQFIVFQAEITTNPDLVNEITGFEDSIRKCRCNFLF